MLVFIIVSIVLYVFLTHGQFHFNMSGSISRESLDSSESIYIGNTVEWDGILRPVILDIKMVDADGRNINFEDDSFEILIEEAENIGSVLESDVQDLNFVLVNHKRYRMKDNDINIVSKLKPGVNEELLLQIRGIKINYSILGNKQEQIMSKDSLVH